MVISLDSLRLTDSERERLEGYKMLYHFGLEHRRRDYPLGTLLIYKCTQMSLGEFLGMVNYLKTQFPWHLDFDANEQLICILVDEQYQRSLPPLMDREYRERVYGQIE